MSGLVVAGTLSVHLGIASAVTLLNKATLNLFSAPTLLLITSVLITLIIFQLASLFGLVRLPGRVTVQDIRSHGLLSFLQVVSLTSKTFCLKLVDASFYQVARSLLLPFTVALSYFILGARTTTTANIGLLIICSGFFFGVSLDKVANTSGPGVLAGVLSSFATALYVVIMKHTTSKAKAAGNEANNSSDFWAVAYYTNLISLGFLIALLPFTGELGYFFTATGTIKADFVDAFVQSGEARRYFNLSLWSGVCFAGLQVVTLLQVKLTSPIAHMVSAAVRGIIQTGLSLIVFPAEAKAFTRARQIGTVLIVVGSTLYAYDEATKKSKAQNLTSSVIAEKHDADGEVVIPLLDEKSKYEA